MQISHWLMTAYCVWAAVGVSAATAPYPKSDRITGIRFDRETLVRSAPGSDIWSCTWAANDQIFAAWGDGGGFGGDDQRGRASIGVATITGTPPGFQGANLWGGFEPRSQQPATVGKGVIVAVGTRLYLYISEQNQWDRCRLWDSGDYGMTWKDSGWIFPQSHKVFAFPGIVEFGRAQELNTDGYIYGLSDNDPKRATDKKIYLFRVKRARVSELAGYEYFSGDPDHPAWSHRIEERQPVFGNAEGVSWGTMCVFHPVTGLFLLASGIDPEQGGWGLYAGEHPWGPWRTIAYGDELPEWTYTPAAKQRPAYLHTFPAKWVSADGSVAWCVYDRGDHLNVVRCHLEIAGRKE